MSSPYVLTLAPVVDIDLNTTTDPSEQLVLTLLPVVQGEQGVKGDKGDVADLNAGNGIDINYGTATISIDPLVVATQTDLANNTTDSQSYTDDAISSIVVTLQADIASGDAATLSTANNYTDTETAQTLVDAKAYTDIGIAAANVATDLVNDLAETNAFKIDQLQNDLDTTNQTAASNYSALDAAKADKTTVATLQTLVDTKAAPADITAAIAALVDGAPDALNTLNEIATALQGDEATIATILTALNNHVRFDAAQALTTTQQDQARSNIDAEKVGTAAALIGAITPASIGAATAAQGAKADSAIQSGDLAPVAVSGSFTSLINKSAVFNLVYSAYVIGSNVGILATDTLGEMLGKLQAQVNAKLDANANAVSATKLATARNINGVAFDGTANITIADSTKEPAITADLVTKFWSGTKTFRDLATDVRAVVLTGLSTATGTAITATDTVLSALGKLQNQVSGNTSAISAITTSFDQSTWSFNDLDNTSNAGGIAGVAFSSGTLTFSINTANTYGAVRLSSSTTTNSGAFITPNQAVYGAAGMLCRSIFLLESAQSTRLLHIGYCASGSFASTELNGVYVEIQDQTAVAWTSRAGTTTNAGSGSLSLNVLYACDIEWITSTSARLVVYEWISKTKVLDQTISSNTPTAAIFPMIKATSSGVVSIPIVVVDYLGRGRARPSYIITPV